MPQMFRKPLLAPGVHHSPNGTLTLTPDRARRYVDKFHQLKSEGVRFPIPWGHSLAATPNNIEFAKSRYNASYIDDLEADDKGNLFVVAQPPPGWTICPDTGDLINPREGTRIGEVSGGFGNWRDGKGRKHRDIVIHAALCTLPVWAGQGGFQWADGPTTLSSAVEYTFLGSSRGVLKMAKEDDEDLDELEGKKKDGPPKEEKGETDAPPTEDDEYMPEPEETDAPPLEEPPAAAPLPTPVAGGDGMETIKGLTQIYAEMGLPLPPAQDVNSFLNNLLVALTVARSMGATFQKKDEQQDDMQPPPATGTSDQPPKPEAPPLMMSTDPVVRQLATEKTERMKSDTSKVWNQLKKLGVPVYICDRETAKSETIMLSLNAKGKVRTPEQLQRARLVREVVQAIKGIPDGPTRNLATSAIETSPTNKAKEANQLDADLYKSMVRAACIEAGATVPKYALEPSKN